MFTSSSNLAQTDSSIIAKYICLKVGSMSHLKLQKLLFYCYAIHFSYFDKELFEENFEAWVHGPVSRKLWNDVKEHSLLHSNINYTVDEGEKDPIEIVNNTLNLEQIQLINETIEELGGLSGFELENMTHSELPWKEARIGYNEGDRCNVVIKKDSIQQYYKTWFS